MRNGTAWVLLLLAGCTVPALTELAQKACNADHPCASGYECVRGGCVIPQGGSCTAGDTQACGSAVGDCRKGAQSCTEDRTWGGCFGEMGPLVELCDGRDNDCNGATDDGALLTAACEKTQGVCAAARRACIDGGFETPCSERSYGASYQAVERSCDGLDNDCNGVADDGQASGGACADAGVCAGGTRACTGGVPGTCQAAGFEATEASCDGLDNDCDGQADEGLESGASCALGAGVCAGKRHACVDAGYEPVCGAASYGPEYEPTESRCDGKDNDCDGLPDRGQDGGVLRAGACELSLGVCNKTLRPCLAGSFESPCSAATYGADYEAIEQTCDGLDNDCDARPDLSVEVGLLKTGNALSEHLSWVYVAGGYSAVYADSRSGDSRVYFRRFDARLQPVGAEVDLSQTGARRSYRPSIARIGTRTVAIWVDELPTSVKRLLVAKLDAAGALLFMSQADGGGTPTRVFLSAPASISGSPRIAVSADDQYILGVWVNESASALGSVIRADGSQLAPATPLSTSGTVFKVAAAATTAPDFVVGFTSLRAATFYVSFVSVPPALTSAGMPTDYATSGAGDLRLGWSGSGGKTSAAWIEQDTLSNPNSYQVRGMVDPFGGAVATIAGPTPELIGALDLAPLAAGPVVAWSQGVTSPRVSARQLGATSVVELTPDGGFPADAPSLAAGGAMIGVGYQSDQGQGLDLFGELWCSP
ncbi:MAG: MopE-related protein [Myxococcaceae bacterium]